MNRLIHRILDSPVLSAALLMGCYLTIAIVGVVGLLSPHPFMSDVALGWPTQAGSWLALIGGTAGAASIPGGVWWAERGAVVFMWGSLGAHIYSAGYRHHYGLISTAELITWMAFLVCIALGLGVRLLHIRGLALDPQL